MRTKIIVGLLMQILGLIVAFLILWFTSILSTIDIDPSRIVDLLLIFALTAGLSGITALPMKKTNKYQREIRNEILSLSILSTLSFLSGILALAYSSTFLIFVSLLLFIWGLSIFLLTIILERLGIYESVINLMSKD